MIEHIVQTPLRQNPRMHHQYAVLIDRQRQVAQPVEPKIPIGRCENLVQSVGLTQCAGTRRDRDEVDVMIAQHHPSAFAQCMNLLKHTQ